MRSLLFAPADDERKLARSRDSGADALILDLEDSVALEGKPRARKLCADAERILDRAGRAGGAGASPQRFETKETS